MTRLKQQQLIRLRHENRRLVQDLIYQIREADKYSDYTAKARIFEELRRIAQKTGRVIVTVT